ncbi:MAG: hypothetical protein ACRD2J_17775 [Thermoanaerobaculia bacterium]
MIFRVALFTLLAFGLTASAQAEHFTADCPLSLVASTPAISSFTGSPHGVFRNGNVVYLLRGDTLTTLETTALGDLVVVREDQVEDLANADVEGGSVYHNGFLFLSGNAGLEVFDLRDVRAGGSAPVLLTRIGGVHYRRMAADGNLLAATFPATDLPCVPRGTPACQNWVDIYNIADPANPVLVERIFAGSAFVGFNDVAFANGRLYTTGLTGTYVFNLTNPSSPTFFLARDVRGEFLATNDMNLLAVGLENIIGVFTIAPSGTLNFFATFTLPSIVNRANDLRFHPDAVLMDTRLITMIDEKDPLTGESARTIAFDVFDFTVPFFEGFDDRIYENVSFTVTNERLFNPVAVGPFVYVVGETSGTQKWGACGTMAGQIEIDSVRALSCGGSEIHGWVSGANEIVNVELHLDGTFLGNANLGGTRSDIVTSNEVVTWRVPVNLDATTRGTRTLRAIGTDVLGNRFQFASEQIFFPGPGQNCTSRRRTTKR